MICVIPINCDSKRLPGKNFRPMCGKPLWMWTWMTAKMFFDSDDIWIICRGDMPEGISRPSDYNGNFMYEYPVGLEPSALNAVLNVPLSARKDGVLLLQPTFVWRDPMSVACFLDRCPDWAGSPAPLRTEDKNQKPDGNMYLIPGNQVSRALSLGGFVGLGGYGDGVDINTQEDFDRAEKILAERLAKAGYPAQP